MKLFKLILFLLFSSCAQLHHIQIGEIVSSPQFNQVPFELKISDVGVEIGEAVQISKVFVRNKNTRDSASQIEQIISLFQIGPRTGSPVYNSSYARNLNQLLYEKCPSGKITGLMSIRETRKYPVISGEIVKIKGYCLISKGQKS